MKIKKWRKYLALLLVLTVAFTGMIAIRKIGAVRAAAPTATSGDGKMQITVENFKINGETPSEGMKVKDGDKISFDLNWLLDNTHVNTDESTFEFDLSNLLENMVLDDYGPFPFDDTGAATPKQMGTFQIKDNKIIIVLEPEYVGDYSGRHGGLEVKGTVHTGLTDTDDGKKIEVGIAEEKHTVTWDADLQPGTADMGKNVKLSRNAEGKLIATYTISITGPWNSEGTARNLQLKDVPGTGLGNMSNITVTGKSWGVEQQNVLQGTYGTLDAFNTDLKNIELKKNDSITIQYTMEILDENDLSGDKLKGYVNNATLSYDELPNEPADSVKKSAEVIYTPPSVQKGGSLSADGKTVTWTITINVGSMYEKGKLLSNYFASVKDTPGAGHLSQVPKDIPLSAFKDNGDGTFTYTYTETLSDEYQDSLTPKEVKNHVDAKETGTDGKVWPADGSVWTKRKSWITKELLHHDEKNKTLKWKVTINIPEDAVELTLQDYLWTRNNGTHTSSGSFSVNGTEVVKNGQPVSGNGIVSSYDSGQNTITFDTTWVKNNQGKTIEVVYETKISDTDLNGKTYGNTANATYKSESGEYSYDSKEAEWSKKNAMTKTGEVVQGENSIKYKIIVDLDEAGPPKLNDVLNVVDTLPEEFDVKAADVSVTLHDGNRTQYLWGVKIADPKVEGNILTVPITITSAIMDAIGEIRGWTQKPYIWIEYTATMKKDAAVDFTKQGKKKKFTNSAEATYNGDEVGDYKTDTELEPRNAIVKAADYSEGTAPYIYYTISVNPDGLNFFGGELKAVDTLGPNSILSYDLNSIKVTKSDGSELAESEWDCVFDKTANSITFTLPDATPLTITYRVLVNAKYDNNPDNNTKLTPGNSTNEFSLYGCNSDTTKDSKSFDRVAITPNAWGSAGTGYITLSKFYSENGKRKILPGAKFAIYEATYNAGTGKFTEKTEPFKADIEIDEEGKYLVENLRYDQIYVLYETEAPEGFKRNTEPYYFVLTGWSGIELPANVKEISSMGSLDYENEIDEDKSGDLIITKSFVGVSAEDVANKSKVGGITFQVKDTGKAGSGKNYYLKDFTYNAQSGKYTLKLPSPVGTYTVTETVTDLDGYEIVSRKYSIDGSGQKSGYSGEVEVPQGGETKIEFENTYDKIPEKGELVITKTIAGDVTKEQAEGALLFTVTDTGNNETNTYTLKQFNYNPTTKKWTKTLSKPVDTYKITETKKDINGYDTVSVKYSINGQGQKTGATATAAVTNGGKTTVDFEDTYSKITYYGKLIIKKTIEGPVASADVANTVTFTVTDIGTNVSDTYKLSDDFTYDKTTKTWTKELKKPVGSYTITETARDINGYDLVSTTYTVNTGSEEKGGKTTVDVSQDETTTVTYKNVYEEIISTGKLVITKTIKGPVTREEAEGALVFTITDTGTGLYREVPLSDFTYDKATGTYKYELTRAVGKTYKITESVKDIEGYILKSLTYTIDGQGPQDSTDDTATATIPDGETVVDFTDEYEEIQEGTLIITKTIEGSVTPEKAAGALKFKVTDTGTGLYSEYTLGDADFKYDATKNCYTLTLTKPVGTYIVEETLSDVTGHRLVSVTYSVGGKEQSGEFVSAEVKNKQTTTVDIKNEYEEIIEQGDLIITKTIEGDVTPDEAEGALQFAVTDTGTDKTTTYTLKDFTLDSEKGIYTLTLTKPVGDYLVEETMSTIDGYKRKSVTYTVNGGTRTDGTAATVKVENGKQTTVAFKDEYEEITEFGTLVITKTIEGEVTPEEAAGALQFKVTDKETGLYDTYTLLDFEYDEEKGIYTLTLDKRPTGTYIVEETLYDVDGYRLTSLTYTVGGKEQSGESVEAVVTDQGTTTVAITDVYEKAKKDGKLVITKTIKGPVTPEEAAGALQFKVTDDKTGISTTYKLSDFTYDAATGIYTLTLTKPAGSYTVEEIITDIYGYVTASVKYSVDGGSQKEEKKTTASVKDGKTTTVAFEDTYTKAENGNLIITKTIAGPVTKEEAEAALKFTVTDVASGITNTYTLKDFSYDEEADKYALSLSKPVGAYTITETVTDIKGYQTASVKYSINGGEQVAGKEATTTVAANQTTTVAYEDKYTKKETGTDKDEDTDTGKTPKDKKKTNGGTPKTGDPRRPLSMLCIFVAILSGVGIVLVNLPRRKKYKK